MEETKNTKKKHRIGIDARVLQEKKPSGIPGYALHLVQEFIKTNKDVEYVLFFNSFRNIKKMIPHFEGVETKVYRIPNKVLEWLWRFFPYPKIDKKLKVDTFFSPHFINIPLSKKVKKVLTIHDLSFIKNKRYFSLRKNLWHWQMSPKKACRSFDKIISVSEATKNDLVKIYKVNPDKIKTIYNGFNKIIDFNTIEQERAVLERYQVEPKKYLLFLATLEPRKNVEGIIDAFAAISNGHDFKLVIAGRKGWLFKNIFKKVKKYSLEKQVVFTDFINEEEKHILFKNAFIFVFPSFCEGFGLPVLEAKNHFLPTITSSVSSLPEVAKQSAILVNPHNTIDTAQAMIELIKNTALRNILLKKGYATRENTWQQTAQQTLDYILS